jgi:hypothetical protein
MGSAHGLQLAAHIIDILQGPFEGVNTALDGGIFSRQPKESKPMDAEH